MTTSANPAGHERRPLRVLDVDLPLLASMAALELDCIAAKRSMGVDSLTKLADIIGDSFATSSDTTTQQLHDPSAVLIVNKAMNDSNWVSAPMKTVDHLAMEAKRLADQFSNMDKPQSGQIETLKQFCLALAKVAAAYRDSIFTRGQSHPYRR
jgi:hypothetical protein